MSRKYPWLACPARLPAALALALALVGASVSAEEETPRYRIEILVFARTGPPNPHFRWQDEPSIGDAERLVYEEPELPLAEGFPQISVERPYAPVEPQDTIQVAERLDRLPGYEVIAWRAWVQEAEVFGDARSVRLNSDLVLFEPELPAAEPVFYFGDPPEAPEPTWLVDGTVTFERGRFPHVGVDLVYRRPLDDGAGSVSYPVRIDREQRYHAYRIVQRQRVTPGEIQYFDHAQFGVLAIVQELSDEPNQPKITNRND